MSVDSHRTPSALVILRLSAMGDCLMLLPALRHLNRYRQQHCPQVPLIWVIERGLLPLFQGLTSEGIQLVGIKKPRRIRDYWQLRQTQQQWLPQVDMSSAWLISFQTSLRVNVLLASLPFARKLGFSHEKPKEGHQWVVDDVIELPDHLHQVESFWCQALACTAILDGQLPLSTTAMVEALSDGRKIVCQDKTLPFVPTQVDGVFMYGVSMPYVVLNPMSSETSKNATPALYVQIVEHILSAHLSLQVVLSGGGGEAEMALSQTVWQMLSPAQQARCVILTGKTSLVQMMALMTSAVLVIGPDTGPLHLANALGVTVLGLYGPTRVQLMGPYGQLDHQVDGFDQVAKHVFHREPQHVPWQKRLYHPLAMSQLTLNDVMMQLQPLLLSLEPSCDQVLA